MALLGADKPAEAPKKLVTPRERIRQRYFPDVVLTTHEGKKVRFYEDLMKDKIVLINMMYAKCEGICPPITTNLVKVQKMFGDRMGKDIFMYSFTLKPEQDTPEVLRMYAEAHKVRKGWTFLTGSAADMELVRRKLGYTDPDPKLDANKTNHTGMIKYGNEPLMRWGSCPGMSKPDWVFESVSWVDWPKDAKGVRK